MGTISFELLLERARFNFKDFDVMTSGGEALDFVLPVEPRHYLEFAEKDLAQGSIHGLINSFTNSKRAIDSQIDKLLRCLGIYNRNDNFPQKIQIIKELGIIAPRVVEKINTQRNTIEHQHTEPEIEKTEDALDIAGLFVWAIHGFLTTCMTEFYIYNPKADNPNDRYGCPYESLFVCYDYSGKQFIICVNKRKECDGTVYLDYRHQYYKDFIKLMVVATLDNDLGHESLNFLKKLVEDNNFKDT